MGTIPPAGTVIVMPLFGHAHTEIAEKRHREALERGHALIEELHEVLNELEEQTKEAIRDRVRDNDTRRP